MAFTAANFVVDRSTPGSAGDRRQVFGTVTLDAAYPNPDGYAFDPLWIGLQIIDSIDFDLAVNDTPIGILLKSIPGRGIVSTLAAGGTLPGHIEAFAVPVPVVNDISADQAGLAQIDNGADLSAYTANFVAWGV